MQIAQGHLTFSVRSVSWFSAGVAVALLLTGVIVGVRANAAPGADEATFVPITPCRLADTRPNPALNVGPRNTPIGAAETHVQQVTGTNGNCTIPADATGVSLNVTAVAPTAASFMTIFPSDATLPAVSNLNYLPAAPPTPNKVDVKLSADGKVSFYNLAGNVHLIADIGGYYTNAGIQDIVADLATAESKISALETVDAGTRLDALEALTSKLNAERPFVWTNRNSGTGIGSTDMTVVDVSLTTPAAGNVTVISTTTVREDTANEFVACSITDGTAFDTNYIQRWESPGASGEDSQLAGVRVFNVTAGQAVTYRLVCKNLSAGSSNVYDPTIAATFTPGP